MKKARQFMADLFLKVFAGLWKKTTPLEPEGQLGSLCDCCHDLRPEHELTGRQGKRTPICDACALDLEEKAEQAYLSSQFKRLPSRINRRVGSVTGWRLR
jgi:hypothetical protein